MATKKKDKRPSLWGKVTNPPTSTKNTSSSVPTQSWSSSNRSRSQSVPELPVPKSRPNEDQRDPINETYRAATNGARLQSSLDTMLADLDNLHKLLGDAELPQTINTVSGTLKLLHETLVKNYGEITLHLPPVKNDSITKEESSSRKKPKSSNNSSSNQFGDNEVLNGLLKATTKTITTLDQTTNRLSMIKKVRVALTQQKRQLETQLAQSQGCLDQLNSTLMSLVMQTIEYISGDERKSDTCDNIPFNRYLITITQWSQTNKMKYSNLVQMMNDNQVMTDTPDTTRHQVTIDTPDTISHQSQPMDEPIEMVDENRDQEEDDSCELSSGDDRESEEDDSNE